jgi:hypothetical protein
LEIENGGVIWGCGNRVLTVGIDQPAYFLLLILALSKLIGVEAAVCTALRGVN